MILGWLLIYSFCVFSLVVLLTLTPLQAITISDVFKQSLEEATKKFEKNILEEGVSQLDLGPVTCTHHRQLVADRASDIRWEFYITYPYMLWDPLSQYKSRYQNSSPVCPLCSADGFSSNILFRYGKWYNGRIKRLNPRVLFGTHSCTLLVSCIYTCSVGHEIAACHPAILGTLDGIVEIPFCLTHRNGFTLDLAILVEELVDDGVSFEQIGNLIERQYKSTYDRFAINFWRDLDLSKKGIVKEQNDIFFPPLSDKNFPRPSNDILMDVFLKRFHQNEHLFKAAMNSLTAQWISCDHTFKSVSNIGYRRAEDGKWIHQYNSIFCIVNEKGEVINWQLTKSEGFDEVKNMFLDIKLRLQPHGLQLICIDNCCKWNSLLTTIFPETAIKQDLFHAVKRFVKTLKKKDNLQRELAAEFGLIFRHPSDLGDTRKMATPGKDAIISNLVNFIKKWKNRKSNGVKLLNKERLAAIANIRGHIVKGCLSDIPVHCSTSVNERLHKDMKKVLSNNPRIGTQLAYAKFSRYFFRHNEQRGNKESVHSLCSKAHQQSFTGEARSNDGISDVCFGVRPKHIATVPPDLFEQLPSNTSSPYTLNDLTPEVLHGIIERIEEVRGLEISYTMESSESSQHDAIKIIDGYFCVLKHALSVFKIMLLVKQLWSSKAINLLKIPFLAQNFKTYSSSNTTSGTTEDGEETSCAPVNEGVRSQHVARSFGFDILPVTGDGNCFFTAVSFQII